MKGLRALMMRLGGLLGGSGRERELEAEMQSHLQLHIDDNLRTGMSAKEARRDALVKLGGLEPAKGAMRERSTLPLVENAIQDVRFALRQLIKNPGFTGTVLVVLALGFGASVAIFAFVDAALIKPLPYRDARRLVSLYESMPTCPRCNVSYQDFLDWKKGNTVFASLEAWGFKEYELATQEGVEPVPGVRVSDGFFRTLGVTPMVGRDFYVGESSPGATRSVLLSYSTWMKRFGGDEHVVGKTVTLSDVGYAVIGVLPKEFVFAPRGRAEFWATLHEPDGCEQRRTCHSLFGLARLKNGVSVKSAFAEVDAITRRLSLQYPDTNRDETSLVVPLGEAIAGDIRPILLMLLSGAGLLLLIACVNVASLLLVRSESRRREMAVRSALGASRGRILRQFVTEGLLLVMAGSAAGLGAAYVAMQMLLKLVPMRVMGSMPYLEQLSLNGRVVGFAAALALMAAVLFAVTPVLSAGNLRGDLAEGTRGSTGTVWRKFGSNLVVLELAVAMVLLVGAGLLGKSLYKLLRVDIGMQPDHLATLQVSTGKAYSEDPKEMGLEREIMRRMESLPGVKAVAISSELPVQSWDMTTRIRVAGRPWNGERNEVPERDVSPSYFSTLGSSLGHGRYFNEAENEPGRPAVAIVNQAFAKKYFPGEDAVGKQIAYALSKDTMQIVGVVGDIKEGELDSANRPILYRPFNQSMWAKFNVIVRSSQAEGAVLPAMRAAILQIDARLATSNLATIQDMIEDSQPAYLHRASAWLVGSFAALALMLGVVGLYGVIAYSVSQRSREIGVRMALGAQRSSVYRMILKDAGGLVAVGVLAGAAASLGATVLMRKMLFGVEPWDAGTVVSVGALLGVAAFVASYVPARRAASVNPVEALRAE